MEHFDMSNYLSVFLDEVEEQIQILDSEVMNLEKNPKDYTTIQNIFRAAHTLKGSSAAMGFEKMKTVTHHLEDMFEQIRLNHIDVIPELVNLIFRGIDLIRMLKEEAVNKTEHSVEIESFIEELKCFNQEVALSKESKQTSILNNYHLNLLEQLKSTVFSAYSIKVTIQEQSLMKSVRALVIHNGLEELGEIISTEPSIEVMEKNEDACGCITFILVTQRDRSDIFSALANLSEIESYVVEEIKTIESECESIKECEDKDIFIQELETEPTKVKVNPTVRVDVDKLEHLMNLVGELVIDQTRLIDVRGKFAEKTLHDEPEFEILDDITNHLNRVITELQTGMMKTRMLPIEQLFNRFPRMVRDTAMKANKQIEFIVKGKETELDRTLIEEISDPIIHLLRNGVDHGIESGAQRVLNGKSEKGTIILSATHEENHVVITISDDGKGIDIPKIKQTAVTKGLMTEEEVSQLTDKEAVFLIFKSGMSTAEKITEISGRGVGMDIVKSHIERLNGIIDIESTPGVGTTFIIKLPLTLAIIRSLLVKFSEKTFAIPLVNVLEIIRLNQEEIQMVKGQEVGMVRGRVLPLVRLKEKLGIKFNQAERKKREFVVVVGIADKRIGIIADKTIGNQEIVIKSLGSYIGAPPYISGATIMGDGSVALILDVSTVIKEYGTQVYEQANTQVNTSMTSEQQLVTFKIDEEEYGLEIYQAKDIIAVPPITKVVDTEENILGIINLRGNMLPVIDLRKTFGLEPKAQTKKSRIIVVEQEGKDIGFLVDEVTEVLKISDLQVEEPKVDELYNHRNLLKGVSKLNNRIILILNFQKVLQIKNKIIGDYHGTI